MRGSLDRLADMLEAIEKYAARGRNVFESEELVQTWVVHHLQILGEAARAMPQAIRDKIPQVAWSKIIGMRHILVHNYRSYALTKIIIAKTTSYDNYFLINYYCFDR